MEGFGGGRVDSPDDAHLPPERQGSAPVTPAGQVLAIRPPQETPDGMMTLDKRGIPGHPAQTQTPGSWNLGPEAFPRGRAGPPQPSAMAHC